MVKTFVFALLLSFGARGHESGGAEVSTEVLEAGEQDVQSCFECVFPADWLNSVADQLEISEEKEAIIVPGETSGAEVLAVTRAAYPVLGPSYFISGLGDRRSGGRRHQGVDLGAKSGTPVGAAWPGRVVWAGWDRLGGNVAKIIHPNGLSTYYAHLKYGPKVREGQLLSSAQVLGAVGNSGNARWTVPHLHFEVRRGRAVLNPLNYIKKPSGKKK